MALFTDTVTIYNKISDFEWKRTVVEGVQCTDRTEKQNNGGKISIAKYIQITFPEPVYEGLILNAGQEEDCIICCLAEEEITTEKGSRVSDLLIKYQKSGRIQSVSDNSKRDFLKNIKVVIG